MPDAVSRLAAILAAVLFAAIFVFWTYYPHGLPLPTSIAGQKSPVTAVVPAAPATPPRPSNPITDIAAPEHFAIGIHPTSY
jgi:hypothetical protein